jgi:hypothetical protein
MVCVLLAGGHWALRDPRHASGAMSQNEALNFLIFRGYAVYLIGDPTLLRIGPDFFDRCVQDVRLRGCEDEGFGPFVQGNALAVHEGFADPLILSILDISADEYGYTPP